MFPSSIGGDHRPPEAKAGGQTRAVPQ
jgi:hypothetical protein